MALKHNDHAWGLNVKACICVDFRLDGMAKVSK